MTIKVNICLGNIFEGGADLTVLPASAKGTISSSCRRWVEIYGLQPPPFDKKVTLGDLSDFYSFPENKISKYYCYAHSVFNDHTTPEALTNIAKQLGDLTKEHEEIKIIQTPLLGTGAGGLKNEGAVKALISGFTETCESDSQLVIFVYDSERHQELQKHLTGFFSRFKDAVLAKPTVFGFGLDLKKLKK